MFACKTSFFKIIKKKTRKLLAGIFFNYYHQPARWGEGEVKVFISRLGSLWGASSRAIAGDARHVIQQYSARVPPGQMRAPNRISATPSGAFDLGFGALLMFEPWERVATIFCSFKSGCSVALNSYLDGCCGSCSRRRAGRRGRRL